MIVITKTSGQAFLHYLEDFEIVWPNASIAIVGPNGTGKTTAARALMWSFIGRFPTPPNISKWTMDLPRPGRFVGVKKTPDTVVKTCFNVTNADGEITSYTITRKLTWDKKMSLLLESDDGVVRMVDKTAQNQIFLFTGVSHGTSADECSKLFMRKHWFGVDQDISIFTASATLRRELLESTNPLALLPRLEEDTAVMFRAENKLRTDLAKGLSSSLGSVSHIWTKIKEASIKTGAAGDLLNQSDLDQDAVSFLDKATQSVKNVTTCIQDQRTHRAYPLDKAVDFIKTISNLDLVNAFQELHVKDVTSFQELKAYLKEYQTAVQAYQELSGHLSSLQAEANQAMKDKDTNTTQVTLLNTAIGTTQSSIDQLSFQIEALAPLSIYLSGVAATAETVSVGEIQASLVVLNSTVHSISRPRLRPARATTAAEINTMLTNVQSLSAKALIDETAIAIVLKMLDQLEALSVETTKQQLVDLGFKAAASDQGFDESRLHDVASAPTLIKELAKLVVPDISLAATKESEIKNLTEKITDQALAMEELVAEINIISTDLHAVKIDIDKLQIKQQKINNRHGEAICEECGSVTDANHVHSKSTMIAEELTTSRALEAQLTEIQSGLNATLSAHKKSQASTVATLASAQAMLTTALRAEDVYLSQKVTLNQKLTYVASAVFGAVAYKSLAQDKIANHDKALELYASNLVSVISELDITLGDSVLGRYHLAKSADGRFSLQMCPAVSLSAAAVTADLRDLAGYITAVNSKLKPRERHLIDLSSHVEGLSAFLQKAEAATNASLTAQMQIAQTTIASLIERIKATEKGQRDIVLEQARLVSLFGSSSSGLASKTLASSIGVALQATEALDQLSAAFPVAEISGPHLAEAANDIALNCQAIIQWEEKAEKVLAHKDDILRYLAEASHYAVIASEKSRKIEALENLKSLLSPNGVARTMVLSSVASQAFDDANQAIKKLDLEKDLHVSVEVVSIAKDDAPPQPALDIIFTVEGQRANLPSNSQGLQVSLALDLAVQSQGGWSGFFIVDEPEQGLDSQTRGKINAWLRGLGRQVIILTNFGTDNFDHVISTDQITSREK